MNKRIIVKVSQLGKATVEADGFQGQGCAEATKGIEDALSGGNGKMEREYKTEWAEQEVEQQEEQHQQL